MALTDDMVMPVSPMGGFGNAGFGGDFSSWIVIFLIFAMFGAGGWGGGGYGGNYDFPWLLSGQNGINANTNAGFQNAAIQSSLGDIQTGLCGGFAGVTAAVNGAQASIAQQLSNNEISSLERSFAAQTASTAGMTNISAQLANCCCENRAATQELKYTLAQEGCNTRAANTANTQAILDKLCELEIQNKDSRIAELERQLTIANLAASQTAQTAALVADNTAQTQYIVNRVAPYPIPSYTVPNPYGSAVAG